MANITTCSKCGRSSDWTQIGTYADRNIALAVLWANRHRADKD